MHTSNTILIKAPREKVFEVTCDLERWPEILPHYRFIQFLEKGPERSRVKMAAMRGALPISWESIHIIDRQAVEQRFIHLKKWTKGMEVVWKYVQVPEGVQISIVHDMNFRFPPLAPIAEPIIGGYFIENVANKTLSTFKKYLESGEGNQQQ